MGTRMGRDPRPRRWVKRLLAAAGLLVVLWLAASYAAVYRLTRRAAPPRPEPVPDVAWGRFEPLRLTASDGVELGAWHVDGRPDRPPVLILHGNGGSRSACVGDAEVAAAAGCPVLLVTMRAHGDSGGDVNDFGRSARHDVAAAVDWLGARHPGRRVVVWGKSLGSAAALFAAADLGGRAAGYVLECPYRDIRSATRNRTRTYLPAGLEFVAYAGFTLVAPLVLDDVDGIAPERAARRVPQSAPVLVLAGGADTRATPADAAAVQAAVGKGANLVVIPGGAHLKLADADPAGYRAAVVGFLELCGATP